MKRILMFSCLATLAIASYADEMCVDTAHAFPTYGADPHLKCWVPKRNADGTVVPAHEICLRITQTATCTGNCEQVPNTDPDPGETLFIWRCSTALPTCDLWQEEGADNDKKVQPAQAGETGKNMNNAVEIKCLKIGKCTCISKTIDGVLTRICLKGSDSDNGDIYQGMEGAACTVPADDPEEPEL